jgi:gliding motility-associated lipoprotein GldD
MRFAIFLKGLCVLVLFSCQSHEYIPKPKGYNRIEMPSHSYQILDSIYPYQFKYSSFAKILKDTSWLSEPFWVDIYYPAYKCNIQITYKKFNDKNEKFDELVEDAHKLTNKHNIKAYAIDEYISLNPQSYHITRFELEGEVPSQYQFYATDSSKHFLRGALYFRTAIKNDSLAPVIEFMKRDIDTLIASLKFTKK